ncbi:MAG: hypothetical protein AUG89_12575 [Acidobacteria bacterium 13_1_20CM_4_56_7]|nr:MAG: hypothetical protein AUG89_12575 [Acidobacteria bacterium 13_1_20CM_4_56_7]
MSTQSAQPPAGAHVNKILEEMYGEFQALMVQRAAILRRIGTIKQTIIGLAKLFGNEVVGERVLQVVEQRSSTRSRGFTRTCRVVLMESTRPMVCQQVCEEIQRRNPTLLAHHKDPLASVNTVLNRLATYGEARIVMNERGKRAWEWATERAAEGVDSPTKQQNSSAPSVEPQKE